MGRRPRSGRLRERAKGRELRVWPDEIGDPTTLPMLAFGSAPRTAGGISQPEGHLQSRRRRRLSAGRSGAAAVPLARVAHPDLTTRVTDYVVLHVLMHHRRQRLYDAQQRERLLAAARASGARPRSRSASWGSASSAAMLRPRWRLGFQGRGLEPHAEDPARHRDVSRRRRARPFLARTEILVCLLPLTPRDRRAF